MKKMIASCWEEEGGKRRRERDDNFIITVKTRRKGKNKKRERINRLRQTDRDASRFVGKATTKPDLAVSLYT